MFWFIFSVILTLFVSCALLIMFLIHPRVRILEVTDDLNAKLYKKARVEGNKLILKNKKQQKAWIIEDATQHFTLHTIFGLSDLYIVSPESAKPLRFNDSCFKKDFITPKTIKVFYDNTMMQKLLQSAKGVALNEKLLIILAIGIVAVAVGYMLLIAPNTVPIEACAGV